MHEGEVRWPGTSQWEGAYEIRFGERQDSPSRVPLCIVLRANRRKLPARAYHASLLLRSQVLRRSLQARGLGTQRTCEGIMTRLFNDPAPNHSAGASALGTARSRGGPLPCYEGVFPGLSITNIAQEDHLWP